MAKKRTKELKYWSGQSILRIGDEPYRYRIEGDQLSLEDLEQAEDDRRDYRSDQAIRDEQEESGTEIGNSLEFDFVVPPRTVE